MVNILRVSNHPSRNRHGVGLHPHKISETNKFNTVFVSPFLNNDNYLEPKNYKLKVSKIIFEKRPIRVSKLKILVFHLVRIYKLVRFSFFCIRQIQKNQIDIIITRDKKDFKSSKIPVMSAKEFLAR